MKRKRTRQQIINELFSNRQVQKLIRELQNLEKNLPHPWTPKDGVIMDGEVVKERLGEKKLKLTSIEPTIRSDYMPSQNPYIAEARLAMEKAGQLPIGLGGDYTYQKLKEQEKNRTMHAFWEKEYINWLTWKHIWIWVKRRIHVSK